MGGRVCGSIPPKGMVAKALCCCPLGGYGQDHLTKHGKGAVYAMHSGPLQRQDFAAGLLARLPPIESLVE